MTGLVGLGQIRLSSPRAEPATVAGQKSLEEELDQRRAPTTPALAEAARGGASEVEQSSSGKLAARQADLDAARGALASDGLRLLQDSIRRAGAFARAALRQEDHCGDIRGQTRGLVAIVAVAGGALLRFWLGYATFGASHQT